MPSLQARVAARGFPVFDASGRSGQGTRPDSTLPSGDGAGTANPAWSNPANDPGKLPATLPPPEPYVMPGMFGLPGASRNPDDTPRTHAAPIFDSTLPRGTDYIEADAAHAPEFTGPAERQPVTQPSMRFRQQLAEGNGAVNLDPVRGQLRANAGFDGVQGYGGGGKGPGGTNEPELTTLDRRFPGEVYTTFTNAAEVPLYVPDALQFIPSEAWQAPWLGGNFDAPTASTRVQGITPADTPDQGQAYSTPASASSFWGVH